MFTEIDFFSGVRKEIVIKGVIKFGYICIFFSWSFSVFSYVKHSECLMMNVWLNAHRYTIWDYAGEGVYVVTVDLAVCLEDGGDCLINVNILDQAKLSKQICQWGSGFLNPGIITWLFVFSFVEESVPKSTPLFCTSLSTVYNNFLSSNVANLMGNDVIEKHDVLLYISMAML